MKIKAVFCDFDDTLCNTRKLYDEAIGVCHEIFNERTGLNLSLKKFKEAYFKAKRETHALVPTAAASHNRGIYFQRMMEDLEDQTDFDLVMELYDSYYEHVYNNVVPFPHAIELIQWIKSTGRKFLIVSDGATNVRMRKLQSVGISKYVDYMVTSEEVGMEKPSTQVFLVALNKAKVSHDEVIFIGNSSKRDIYGAELANMKTIWVDINKDPEDQPKSEEEKADYTVTDLIQVKEIIEKLESSE